MDYHNETSKIEAHELPLLASVLTAASFAVILVTLLTVFGELVSPLKNFLKTAFYHHWIGKGVLALLLFVLSTLIMKWSMNRFNHRINIKNYFLFLLISLLCGTAIIFLFFVYEYIAHH